LSKCQDINAVVSSIPNIRPAVALDASATWEDWPSEVQELEGKFRDQVISSDGLQRLAAVYDGFRHSMALL